MIVLIGVLLAVIGMAIAVFSDQRTVGLVLTVLGIALAILGALGVLDGAALDTAALSART